MRNYYLGITLFILVSSVYFQCSSTYNDSIENVLDNAGNKRADLEDVLVHYQLPADSLKRKAAYFLVENFPEDKYQTIDKQLLIENIELAFQVWKKPWAKQLNFEEFKELVLPFDLERDSTGTFWRKRFMDEYAFVEDSLKNYPDENTVVAACMIVDRVFKQKYDFEFIWNRSVGTNTLNAWERIRRGNCAEMSYLTNQVMHAIGVPTAIEFTPQWANAEFRHYWTVALVNHRFIPFMGRQSPPRQLKVELDDNFNAIRKRAKVFRKMYAINPSSLAAQANELFPSIFQEKGLFDVSNVCLPTHDATVIVPDSIKQSYLYLCVAQRQRWKPVAWGKVTNHQVVFSSIRQEAVYLPTRYADSVCIPFDYPFILKKDGQKHQLIPQLTKREKIICEKRYYKDPTNLVKIGDTYQLYYWDRSGWQLLTTKIANSKTITFDNVPSNALLLLKDATRGRKESVFTYHNQKQVFW